MDKQKEVEVRKSVRNSKNIDAYKKHMARIDKLDLTPTQYAAVSAEIAEALCLVNGCYEQ